MKLYQRFKHLIYLPCLLMMFPLSGFGQQSAWDIIKADAAPVLTAPFADQFSAPEMVPLADYGWEDGLQVSYDGLHLYALYAPADLLSWVGYFAANPGLPICSTLGSGAFIRDYAGDYGMDIYTNYFACDTFMNLDILYATRPSIDVPFSNWILSDIARPGEIEGGPFPLFSDTDPDAVDHFLFTGPGSIWMINNTTANPSNIASAVRLPSPINPVSDEFTADNPMLTRLDNSDLLLVYEKYTNPDHRDFMFTISDDEGASWTTPTVITTINNDAGHIEHPMLYFDGANYWFYYSQNFDIYRARQGAAGNWDSWTDHEAVILKGNTVGIGEPSITSTGDIYFVAVIQNPDNPDDLMDADPWYVKKLFPIGITTNSFTAIEIHPNPADAFCTINTQVNDDYVCRITNLFGQEILSTKFIGKQMQMDVSTIPPGTYMMTLTGKQGDTWCQQLVVM